MVADLIPEACTKIPKITLQTPPLTPLSLFPPEANIQMRKKIKTDRQKVRLGARTLWLLLSWPDTPAQLYKRRRVGKQENQCVLHAACRVQDVNVQDKAMAGTMRKLEGMLHFCPWKAHRAGGGESHRMEFALRIQRSNRTSAGLVREFPEEPGVFLFLESHDTVVCRHCVHQGTDRGQPSLRICFPFQMLKKPKWKLHRRATPEGCIATTAGARAEEGAAEK